MRSFEELDRILMDEGYNHISYWGKEAAMYIWKGAEVEVILFDSRDEDVERRRFSVFNMDFRPMPHDEAAVCFMDFLENRLDKRPFGYKILPAKPLSVRGKVVNGRNYEEGFSDWRRSLASLLPEQ